MAQARLLEYISINCNPLKCGIYRQYDQLEWRMYRQYDQLEWRMYRQYDQLEWRMYRQYDQLECGWNGPAVAIDADAPRR